MTLCAARVSVSVTKAVLAEPCRRAEKPSVTLPWWREHWARDDRGQDLIEYAVLAAFVSLMAVIGAAALNHATGAIYGSTAARLNHGANFATTSSTTSDPSCAKSQDNTSTAEPSCK